MYVCVYDLGKQDTRQRPAHDRNTTGKERDTGKAGKPAYIGKFADNEKKVQKKSKKIWK